MICYYGLLCLVKVPPLNLLIGIFMTGSSALFHSENKNASTPLVFILLGPPGSGKGTQAALIKDQLQLPHISTGDLLRDNIRRETTLGNFAKTYMNKGQLVPDQVILDMLFDRVSGPDCFKGYILDGFPRTLAQAEALQVHLKGISDPVVINLNLSNAEIIERLTNRFTCETCGAPYNLIYFPPKKTGICNICQGNLTQRNDDTQEIIEQRLKVYHKQTAPLIAFYADLKLLHSIDCRQSKENVFAEIKSLINPT